jgi:plasmid segregation protein ParM
VDHNVGGIVDSAVKEIGAQILREAKRRIGDAAEMQSVILVGGGAALMRDVIAEAYPHVHVPENPEQANARGMRKYLQYMVGE